MIRALIVDDSSFMRKAIRYILESDGSIEVVDTASNGKEAIEKIKLLHPDVVLLDIEMPIMDGLSALAHIMAKCPTPVLMLSGLADRDATLAIKSLEYGAVDFIPKPSGVISYDIDKAGNEIISKVKVAASVHVHKIDRHLQEKTFMLRAPALAIRKEIVVIGASTGGPRAISKVLSGLPREISASIIVVQHMDPHFVPSFVERLRWESLLNISLAQNREKILPGRVYVAPGGNHMGIEVDGETKRFGFSSQVFKHTGPPSIDYAMESAADVYGEDVIGVLLTGMGMDGARGMKAIKDAGGYTIAQDESTSVVFGMPKVAIETGCIDKVVSLPNIAQAILKMI